MSTYPNDNYFHFPRYQSKFSGEEIDSLLDKVKLDLVDSDLKKQVEDNTTAEARIANMLHLGAYDTYTYDGTTGKYTVTRKTTYNNDGTQSESSSKHIETLSDRYFARTGQPYIEEWKKSEADRSSNLCNTFDRSNIPSDSSLYSATLNPDGSYTSTETNDGRPWSYSNSDFKFILEPGTYTLSAIIKSSDESAGIHIYDSNNNMLAYSYGASIDLHKAFTLTSRTAVGIMVKSYTGSVYIMLNRGSVALPYQPYEGEVVHKKGLAETLSAYPTSQSVSETYLSKADASSTYVAKSSLNVNTGVFDPTSDNPAGQKSLVDFIIKTDLNARYSRVASGNISGAFGGLPSRYSGKYHLLESSPLLWGEDFTATLLFAASSVKEIDNSDALNNMFVHASTIDMSYAFHNDNDLVMISATYSLSRVVNLNHAFDYCFNLRTIKLRDFSVSFNISGSINFGQSDLVEIIGNLVDLTGKQSQTLTMGATNLAKLTDAEKAVAVNKNWVLA